MGVTKLSFIILFGCLFLCFSSPAFSTPFTETTSTAQSDIDFVEVSDPHFSEASSSLDNFDTTWYQENYASSYSDFGISDVLIDLRYRQNYRDSGYPEPFYNEMGAQYKFHLYSPEDGTIDVIDLSWSGNSSVDSIISTDFEFTYGTTYEIQSILSMNGTINSGAATTYSMWSDDITFSGDHLFDKGVATFILGLEGYLFAENDTVDIPMLGWDGPWAIYHSAMQFEAALKSIVLPADTWIEVGSETKYAQTVPEPTSMFLLGSIMIGLFGLRRRGFQGKINF